MIIAPISLEQLIKTREENERLEEERNKNRITIIRSKEAVIVRDYEQTSCLCPIVHHYARI